MKIAIEHCKGKQIVDHRTHFIDRGIRYLFITKAITF